MVLEKTLENPLDCKDIQSVHPKGDQPWDFFGKTDVEAETPILWPPHAKSWLIGKDSDAGRDWGQEEKGTTEDELAGWHHWLDGNEFEWTPGVGDGQGSPACCDSWGCKESDTTEWLNWTELIYIHIHIYPTNLSKAWTFPNPCLASSEGKDLNYFLQRSPSCFYFPAYFFFLNKFFSPVTKVCSKSFSPFISPHSCQSANHIAVILLQMSSISFL